MHEQVLRLAGDPDRPVTLEATLFEPPGGGPFPLAVMNHGAKGLPRTVERYKSSPGFSGTDFVALTVTEGAKPAQTMKFAIHVN